MAKDNRCALCGGRLLPSGKCVSCGWDNSKKDAKYRLNAHNENTVHLHADDCETNLNRDNDGSPVRLNIDRGKTAGTAAANKMGGQKQSSSAGSNAGQAQSGSQTQSSGQAQSSKKSSNWARANLNREKRRAQSTKNRVSRREAAKSEKTTRQFAAADAGKRSSSRPKTAGEAAAKRKGKNTKSGGAGKGLRRVIGALVVIFIFVYVLGEFLDEFFPMLLVDVSETIGDMLSDGIDGGDDYDDWDDYDDREDSGSDEPARQEWNEDAVGYLIMELTQGNYYVGYDIPAGTYQVECLEGNVYVTWDALDGESGEYGFVILYSEEAQEEYSTWMNDEECPWYELSPVFDLTDGMVLTIENAGSGLLLTGEGEGIDSLADHETQSAIESIYLGDEMTMTVGEDFEAGVYDLVIVGGDSYAWVDVEKEDGTVDGISLSTYENMEEYLRYTLEDGYTVTVSTYGTDVELMLRPSW